MTAPRVLPPPLDPYHRPARELAGYASKSFNNGDEVTAPIGPRTSESITLLAVPGGRGFHLVNQPAALTDYLALNKVRFDASSFNGARIVVQVHQPGVTGARFRLFYSTTGEDGTWVNAGVDLDNNPRDLVCKIDTPGIRDGSGPIAVESRDDYYWAVMSENGDGTVTPVIGNVYLQFLQRVWKECTWTVVVPPEDMVESGLSMPGDLRWVHSGSVDGFQTGCVAPSCLAFIAIFRFGSGPVLNHSRTRVFSVADFPELTPGKSVRLTGEMQWSYLHLACGVPPNPDVRLTLSVNDVVYSNVPSGFPPTDPGWLPFEILLPADGTGVTVGVGVYGDSGTCSLSIIGGFRNFQIEVLDDETGDCI